MKDWKTTLAGLVAGVLQMAATGMNWKGALAAAAVAALGAAAKDTTSEAK